MSRIRQGIKKELQYSSSCLPCCVRTAAPVNVQRAVADGVPAGAQAQAQTLRRVGRGGLHEEGSEGGAAAADPAMYGVGARGEVRG